MDGTADGAWVRWSRDHGARGAVLLAVGGREVASSGKNSAAVCRFDSVSRWLGRGTAQSARRRRSRVATFGWSAPAEDTGKVSCAVAVGVRLHRVPRCALRE